MHFYKFLLSLALCFLSQLVFTSVAFSFPIVKVSSNETSQEIKELAELYLAHLDVRENVHLTISLTRNMPELLSGITISLPVQNPEIDHMLLVLVDAKLDKATQRRVLAHEMIHVKQYAKRELVIEEDIVFWMGNKYRYHRDFNLYTPWELEAHQADRSLAKLVQGKKKQSDFGGKKPGYTYRGAPGGNEEYLGVESNAALQPENSSTD